MKKKLPLFMEKALHHTAVAAVLILIAICGVTILTLAENPSVSAVSHTPAQTYSWYYKPRTDGELPICADDAPFIENYDNVLYHGKDDSIYLTFDTGYENGNTEAILDILKEKKVPAAFFVTGHYVKTNPELVLRMKNEGHLVLNHSLTHADLAVASKEKFLEEAEGLSALYREVTGEDMAKFIRPPEGKYSENFLRYAKEEGYRVVFWTFAYRDWVNDDQPSNKEAMETILSRTHKGMIALLHSNSAANAAVLGNVIDEWQSMGFSLKPLTDLS